MGEEDEGSLGFMKNEMRLQGETRGVYNLCGRRPALLSVTTRHSGQAGLLGTLHSAGA